MDWLGLLSWILAAMFGGAVGGLVGSMLPVKDLRWIAMIVAGAIGASVGAMSVQPEIESFLDRQFGEAERRESFESIYERQIKPELLTNPALARIFADFPAQEGEFKSRLRASYEEGGEEKLVADSREAGAMLAPAVNFYIPRAKNRDLVRFAAIMGDLLAALGEKDGQACFDMQFGAAYGHPLNDARFQELAGQALLERQADVVSSLIVGADKDPVTFDAARADAIMSEFRANRPLLDAGTAAIAGGQREPANAAEAKAACDFTSSMFRDIAALPEADAALIMRSIASR